MKWEKEVQEYRAKGGQTMADLKPFEVIMRLYPIAGQNGKGEVCMKAERVSELIRCKDCKHRFVDGENVRFNVCELNHNKVQADDWFCADGKRRDENE